MIRTKMAMIIIIVIMIVVTKDATILLSFLLSEVDTSYVISSFVCRMSCQNLDFFLLSDGKAAGIAVSFGKNHT
jgi:hypothetical protein